MTRVRYSRSTTPRKSPKQERSRGTIEAILTATARVLVKEGFDKASTNRIADQAGVSIGSLYQYFPSKEALVAALIERHTEEMSSVLTEAFDRVAALPVPEAAREMVALMLRAHSIDPALHRVLIEQVPRVGRLSRIHEVEGRAEQMVRAYLALHRDELRVADLDAAAFLVVSTVEALTHAAVIYHPERLKTETLAAEVTAMVVRYLAK
jgi:AcrR family transcriptional regulator